VYGLKFNKKIIVRDGFFIAKNAYDDSSS